MHVATSETSFNGAVRYTCNKQEVCRREISKKDKGWNFSFTVHWRTTGEPVGNLLLVLLSIMLE